MALKDIQGQDSAVEFFRNSINRKRLAQVYLFSGAQGVGKTLAARNLAKILNCETPVKDGDMLIDCCDSCVSCRKIENSNHPDIHWIAGGEQGEKISIDDIRAAQKKIYLKNLEGRVRIFIILEAQEMTPQAANSLLKSMEELPASCLIILTSSNIGGLLNTIISRCQIVRFVAFERGCLSKILIEQYQIDPGEARFLSLASEGRLGRALELKEKNALSVKNRLIEQLRDTGHFTLGADIFNVKDKKEMAVQLGLLLNWFRDILVVKAALARNSDIGLNIINSDKMEQLKEYSRLWAYSQIEAAISKIDETYRLLDQNINARIAVEAMLAGLKNAGSSLS
ncbi:MAG: AAA family ATPase [Candidatus Omnitrophota bacterium]